MNRLVFIAVAVIMIAVALRHGGVTVIADGFGWGSSISVPLRGN